MIEELKKDANNVQKEVCLFNWFHIFSELLKYKYANAKTNVQVEEDFGTGKFVKYQICLWDLIEKPHTSFAAKVFT